MTFPRTGSGITAFMAEAAESNQEVLQGLYEERLQRIQLLIDIQHEIAAQYSWMFDSALAPRNEAERVAFHLFQKTGIGLFDSLRLTEQGSFGSARVLLRQVFEALLLAKFCAISEDHTVALNWHKGDAIYVGKAVLGRIVQPDPVPLTELWGILCDYAHATKYSQKGRHRITEDVEHEQVALTLVYIELLAECAYHVLNTWVLRKDMAWYAREYGKVYTVPDLRSKARELFTVARQRHGPGARTLIRTFRSRWVLKPVDPTRSVETIRYSIGGSGRSLGRYEDR